jgi:predicted RND superfamily exporter protein
VPLMLEQSSQSAFLKPTVISLAFGLVVAFFVTLFLVPALLILGDKLWRRILAAVDSIRLRASYEKAKFDS